jgi:ATP-dependent exoDNAse (exonuclease V) alpha subunit
MTQDKAYEIIMSGQNIFLTGEAGTGKTWLLNKVIKDLREQKKIVAVTASTGIASTHIGGSTIHSWAGIGIKEKLDISDLYKIKNFPKAYNRIRYTDVLIIDEISMIHGYRLDLVDEVLRFIKDSGYIFGGVQIILVGDFFQLPPVSKRSNESNYTFNSESWKAANLKVCYLDKNYRQSEDAEFKEILNALRNSKVTNDMKKRLTNLRENKTHMEEAINLYCTNDDVSYENYAKLSIINSTAHDFIYETKGEPKYVEKLTKDWMGESKLTLKKGAKVMTITNHPDQLYVNGSMGKIVGFADTDEQEPIIEFYKTKRKMTMKKHEWKLEDDNENGFHQILASIYQYPIKLAYAISVHKSQGCTFDYINLDLTKAFNYNMGYVALSRCTSLDGIYLSDYNYASLQTDPVVISKDKEFRSQSLENEKDVKA